MTLQDALDNPNCWSARTEHAAMVRDAATGEATIVRVVNLSEHEPVDLAAEVIDATIGRLGR